MSRLFTEKMSCDLEEADTNKFYMLDRSLIPEAFPQFYKIEVPDDVRKMEPKGGSRSISTTFRVSKLH